MKATPARKAKLAKIHIARKELSMADDDYRAMLKRITGKTSSADCRLAQLDAVIDELRRLGWKPSSKHGVKPRTTKERKAKLDKIGAILADMGLHWNYVHGMAKKMHGIDRVEWLHDNKLHAVLQALIIHQKRKQESDNE